MAKVKGGVSKSFRVRVLQDFELNSVRVNQVFQVFFQLFSFFFVYEFLCSTISKSCTLDNVCKLNQALVKSRKSEFLCRDFKADSFPEPWLREASGLYRSVSCLID